MTILFNKTYPDKLTSCISNRNKINFHFNLYVKFTGNCNSTCSFCIYRNIEKFEFDKYKFFYTLSQIVKTVPINKISFTGGEPSLYNEKLCEVVSMISDFNPNIRIIISTNGSRLDKLVDIAPMVHSFSISRHHYLEEQNKRIFDNKDLSLKKIASFTDLVGKKKVHVTCNLMRDYISTPDDIYYFMNHVSEETGVNDFGFVGMMPTCHEAIKQKININDIDFRKVQDTLLSRKYRNGEICRCRNFLTCTKSGNIVKFYVRQTLQNVCGNFLVYEKNQLFDSFGGQKLFG